MLMDLTLPLSIELGRTRMTVQDILRLGRGSVVQLERLAGEPIDLYVADRRFAEGEVVVLGEHFGVRITRIISSLVFLRASRDVGSMMGVLLTLGFVLALLGVVLKLLRKFAPTSTTGARLRMEIVQRLALGPKQGIAVIRVGDRHVAVSVGEGGIHRLFELEPGRSRPDACEPGFAPPALASRRVALAARLQIGADERASRPRPPVDVCARDAVAARRVRQTRRARRSTPGAASRTQTAQPSVATHLRRARRAARRRHRTTSKLRDTPVSKPASRRWISASVAATGMKAFV